MSTNDTISTTNFEELTRTVTNEELSPGSSTTVEVVLETEEGNPVNLDPGELVRIDDSFSPGFADVEVTSFEPGGGDAGSGEDNTELVGVWNEETELYSVTYDVTVPDDMAGEIILSGTLTVGDIETALPAETITVDGPVNTTLTLQNVGDSAWQVTDIDGDDATADLNVDNPEIVLAPNTRYEIINQGSGSHPLAFEAADGTVLLSQDGDGSFEDDEAVEWIDQDDAVEFTVTESLANELATYVCTVHGTMEGSIKSITEEPDEPENPDEEPEEHESGVSQELFDAVDQSGDGEVSLGELRDAVNEWSTSQQINGVEATLGDLRAIVEWWAP